MPDSREHDALPGDEPLGEYFVLAEFTASATADAMDRQVYVLPGTPVVQGLRLLVVAVLDPLRHAVGEAVHVESGYRPPWLNRAVGGAEDSQHVSGEAADVWAPSYRVDQLAREVVRLGLSYDQVIVEHDQGVVHVSHVRGRNRREALTRLADPDSGDLVYLNGVLNYEQALRTAEEAGLLC